ncbi:MAG: right-handed parallel beta-helix repeat-containing protein [archaeon]
MNKKIILIGLLVGIVLISGCIQEKECKSAEDCPNKQCFTKGCTDYNCSYSEILPCCGNEICDEGAETHSSCLTDCPNCNDENKCTTDSYDYPGQKCTNEPIIPCCGNGLCDVGETYKECAVDCVKSGVLNKDDVWGGTIHVTGDINVIEGATLTILPGTIIEVAAMSDDQHGGVDHPHDPPFPKDPDRIETKSTRIMIAGTLNASGTQDNKILFTSDSDTPTTYDWDGLSINHGKLEYAIVEYSRYNNFQESSDVVLANSIIRNSLECCICIGHNKPISPQILNNEIYNCGHEGIDYAGGSSLIKGNYFHLGDRSLQPDPDRGGVGIVIYKNAYPVVEENVIEGQYAGVYLNQNFLYGEEEGKKAIFRNNRMTNNRVDFNIDSGYPTEAIVMENNS